VRLYHDGEPLSEFWANREKVDTIDEKPCYIDYEIQEQICSMICSCVHDNICDTTTFVRYDEVGQANPERPVNLF
jgi:hypothetical protein